MQKLFPLQQEVQPGMVFVRCSTPESSSIRDDFKLFSIHTMLLYRFWVSLAFKTSLSGFLKCSVPCFPSGAPLHPPGGHQPQSVSVMQLLTKLPGCLSLPLLPCVLCYWHYFLKYWSPLISITASLLLSLKGSPLNFVLKGLLKTELGHKNFEIYSLIDTRDINPLFKPRYDPVE